MGNLREKHCEPEPCSQPTLSPPLLPSSPADRVFSLRQRASGAAAVWNAANCDAEQTAPTPAYTQCCCCCWQGRVSILWACAHRAASPASPASTARQGVELNQLSLKVCKLVMHRRGAEMGAWHGLAWHGVAHLCVIYCYFLSTFLSEAAATTAKSIQR